MRAESIVDHEDGMSEKYKESDGSLAALKVTFTIPSNHTTYPLNRVTQLEQYLAYRLIAVISVSQKPPGSTVTFELT